MSYSIEVSAHPMSENAPYPAPFFSKEFNTFEAFEPVASCCNSERRIDLFESLLIPIRTNTFNNFCEDFFLPTLINHALKYNDIALKIISSVVFFIFDVVTLPIRLITVIPRYLYNAAHPKEHALFYQYLIKEGISPNTLSADYVLLKIRYLAKGGVLSNEGSSLVTTTETFNFIQLPKTASPVITRYSQQGLKQDSPCLIQEITDS